MSAPPFSSSTPEDDNPTLRDRLGYESYAKALAKLIHSLRQKHSGLVIGLYGKWGMGKSSLLRMLARQVSASSNTYKVVSFNAWQYAQKEEVAAALLRKIVLSIKTGWWGRFSVPIDLFWGRLDKSKFLGSVLQRFISLIIQTSLFFSLLFTLGGMSILLALFLAFFLQRNLLVIEQVINLLLISGVSLGSFILSLTGLFLQALQQTLREIAQVRFNPNAFTQHSQTEDFNAFVDDFAKDLQAILQTPHRQNTTLVVLVDDLDRCSPEQIIPVLEAIKIFTAPELLEEGFADASRISDRPTIVVVLAVDQAMIEQAVLAHYRGRLGEATEEKQLKRLATDYLQKIIQIPFALPPLSEHDVNRFLDTSTKPSPASDDRAASQWSLTSEAAFEQAKPLFEQALGRNLREIKRARNLFKLDWLVAEQRGLPEPPVPQLLALVTLLRLNFPSIYELLPEYPELIEQLYKFANAMEENSVYDFTVPELKQQEIILLGCPLSEAPLELARRSTWLQNALRVFYSALKSEFIKRSQEDIAFGLRPAVQACVHYNLPLDPPNEIASINLLAHLLSGDPTRVERARKEVVKGGGVMTVQLIEAVALKLDDTDLSHCERAIFALGRINHPRSVEYLKTVLERFINADHPARHQFVWRGLYAFAHQRNNFSDSDVQFLLNDFLGKINEPQMMRLAFYLLVRVQKDKEDACLEDQLAGFALSEQGAPIRQHDFDPIFEIENGLARHIEHVYNAEVLGRYLQLGAWGRFASRRHIQVLATIAVRNASANPGERRPVLWKSAIEQLANINKDEAISELFLLRRESLLQTDIFEALKRTKALSDAVLAHWLPMFWEGSEERGIPKITTGEEKLAWIEIVSKLSFDTCKDIISRYDWENESPQVKEAIVRLRNGGAK